MKKSIILGLLMLAIFSPVHVTKSMAFVVGESNFPLGMYDSHNCSRPFNKPYKPHSFSSQWEVDNYNREVRRYNSEIRAYEDCINTYLEGCANDIRRIKEKANEVINGY